MLDIKTIALISGIALPFWNIPLIIRIIKRKSSEDISTYWVWGIWACLLLMAPYSLISSDIVLRAFNLVNFVIFSLVLVVVLAYRTKRKGAGIK